MRNLIDFQATSLRSRKTIEPATELLRSTFSKRPIVIIFRAHTSNRAPTNFAPSMLTATMSIEYFEAG